MKKKMLPLCGKNKRRFTGKRWASRKHPKKNKAILGQAENKAGGERHQK